jgi:hypothetical protein
MIVFCWSTEEYCEFENKWFLGRLEVHKSVNSPNADPQGNGTYSYYITMFTRSTEQDHERANNRRVRWAPQKRDRYIDEGTGKEVWGNLIPNSLQVAKEVGLYTDVYELTTHFVAGPYVLTI